MKMKEKKKIENNDLSLTFNEFIYFKFGKNYLEKNEREHLIKLVNILTDNSELNLEISSHTDSRGKSKYNMLLSKKRTQVVSDYLVKNGIDKNRLIKKYYGEKKLLNKCSNGIKCSKEEHRVNRRTEFNFIKSN